MENCKIIQKKMNITWKEQTTKEEKYDEWNISKILHLAQLLHPHLKAENMEITDT